MISWSHYRRAVLGALVAVSVGCSGGGRSPSSSPPAGLTYSLNPATYIIGDEILSNTPSSTGGVITSYSVAPALPPGLSLNVVTGAIGGTPTGATNGADYTVTGSNGLGSTTAVIRITVKPLSPPSGLVYSANPVVYEVGTAIPPNTLFNQGGSASAYSIAPTLPTGLGLDTRTGAITGTPTTVTPQATYTVTATNRTGSAAVGLSIAVGDRVPRNLRYSAPAAAYTKGAVIVPNTPMVDGGAVVAYTVAPPLPLGLSLNTATGVISGTPTTVTPSSAFTITATNSGGSVSASLSITVNDVPPTALAYSVNPVSYVGGRNISPNAPTSGGGAVVSYSVAPGLPSGLTLNPSTGVITGAPTALMSGAYTVTARNTGGSATVVLSITVSKPPSPTVTVQPVSQVVSPGQPVQLSVVAVGSDVLYYQWSKRQIPIPGATSAAYTTPPINYTDNNATFSVVVSDAFGQSATSNSAVLTVQGFSPAGSMQVGRYWHTTTTMADGTVLVAGGDGPSFRQSSAEVFDPIPGTFSATGAMHLERYLHTGTLLANGKVLIAGGMANSGNTRQAELYDPTARTFTMTGSMLAARSNHAAVRLPNGKVLITGGSGSTSADLYDPTTGAFTATGAMNVARAGHTATLLANGKVLVAGGFAGSSTSASAEIYDPSSGTFALTDSMVGARAWHTATLLPSGLVLVAGGTSGGTQANALATAELFDATNGSFASTGSLAAARYLHTAALLQDGRVLVAGGAGTTQILGSAELYVPPARSFTATGSMAAPRYSHTAVLLQSGAVVEVGGTYGISSANGYTSCEAWTGSP